MQPQVCTPHEALNRVDPAGWRAHRFQWPRPPAGEEGGSSTACTRRLRTAGRLPLGAYVKALLASLSFAKCLYSLQPSSSTHPNHFTSHRSQGYYNFIQGGVTLPLLSSPYPSNAPPATLDYLSTCRQRVNEPRLTAVCTWNGLFGCIHMHARAGGRTDGRLTGPNSLIIPPPNHPQQSPR